MCAGGGAGQSGGVVCARCSGSVTQGGGRACADCVDAQQHPALGSELVGFQQQRRGAHHPQRPFRDESRVVRAHQPGLCARPAHRPGFCLPRSRPPRQCMLQRAQCADSARATGAGHGRDAGLGALGRPKLNVQLPGQQLSGPSGLGRGAGALCTHVSAHPHMHTCTHDIVLNEAKFDKLNAHRARAEESSGRVKCRHRRQHERRRRSGRRGYPAKLLDIVPRTARMTVYAQRRQNPPHQVISGIITRGLRQMMAARLGGWITAHCGWLPVLVP